MTLADKIYEEIHFNIYKNESGCIDGIQNATNSVKMVVEDFTIGFAEWICEKAEVPYIKGKMDTTLKIYKKFKGL